MSDNDSFGDDEDFDFDTVYKVAEKVQQLQNTQLQTQLKSQTPKLIQNNNTKQGNTNDKSINNDQIYEIKGENAILRGQIAKLQKEQTELQNKLKLDFDQLLKNKDLNIESLTDNINKLKSENEFLVSENKNLYQSNSKKRKIKSNESYLEYDTSNGNNSNNLISTSTQNTSGILSPKNNNDINEALNIISDDNVKEEVKVILVNQATFFQDEKTLFIEAISNFSIPGMKKPTLNYLENINSTFTYINEDFKIFKNENSFKSAILKYLVNFQEKNRIDYLLLNFINILVEYITKCDFQNVENTQLLPVPYLLSLINFSLNYKPKAINDVFIGKVTDNVIQLLLNFQELFKPEFDYLSLPGSSQMINFIKLQNDSENNEVFDYLFIEKTMHIKILEVFSATFLMDILTTISKVTSFHMFTFTNSKSSIYFWNMIPQQLFINSCLSIKTPIHFIYSTIVILINSIVDDDKFAFKNAGKSKGNTNDNTVKILEHVMQFLLKLKPSQIQLNVYGLNRMIGSNNHIELLNIISIPSNELSSQPKTNSFDTYNRILNEDDNDFKDFSNQEFYILKTKMLILELFETFYSTLIMISLPLNLNLNLIQILCQLVGEEQEIIYRNFRSANNNLRIELISKSIKIMHYLITREEQVTSTGLSNSTLREMIIVMLRILSNNMKNISIEFITNLRKNLKVYDLVFNKPLEFKEHDKFGTLNKILSIDQNKDLTKDEIDELVNNMIQIDIDSYNGIEFNYPDETISLARDIVESSVTVDEADRLHESINYNDQNFNNNDVDIEMMYNN